MREQEKKEKYLLNLPFTHFVASFISRCFMDVLRGDRTWLLWKETGRKRQALKDGKDDSFYSPVLASVTDSLPSVLQSLKASRGENVSSVFLSV